MLVRSCLSVGGLSLSPPLPSRLLALSGVPVCSLLALVAEDRVIAHCRNLAFARTRRVRRSALSFAPVTR